MENVYRLRPMVAARLFAEILALAILVLLPLFLLVNGVFLRLSMIARSLGIAVALVSLVILPAYGFITYKVVSSEDGLRTFSVFKKQVVLWKDVKSLKLKTSWGFRRYVVAASTGDLSFPIWLMDLRQLCESIRQRLLPKGLGGLLGGEGAGGPAPPKTFTLAPSAVVVQVVQMLGALFFVGLMWMFFVGMQAHSGKPVDPSDRLTMLGACVIFSLFIVARVLFYLVSPWKVVVDATGLQIATCYNSKQYPWSSLKGLGASPFLLPEGLLLKTGGVPVIICDQLDAFDELQDELLKRMPPAPVPQK